jgi:hypothetical protein
MSEKLDRWGNKRGPYLFSDMKRKRLPDLEAPSKTSWHYYLPFHLRWEITEMQLKISYKPQFQNAAGKPTTQLGMQIPATSDLFHISTHESRSAELYRDIEFTDETRARSRALQQAPQQVPADCLSPLVLSKPLSQAENLNSPITSFNPINSGLLASGIDLGASPISDTDRKRSANEFPVLCSGTKLKQQQPLRHSSCPHCPSATRVNSHDVV